MTKKRIFLIIVSLVLSFIMGGLTFRSLWMKYKPHRFPPTVYRDGFPLDTSRKVYRYVISDRRVRNTLDLYNRLILQNCPTVRLFSSWHTFPEPRYKSEKEEEILYWSVVFEITAGNREYQVHTVVDLNGQYLAKLRSNTKNHKVLRFGLKPEDICKTHFEGPKPIDLNAEFQGFVPKLNKPKNAEYKHRDSDYQCVEFNETDKGTVLKDCIDIDPTKPLMRNGCPEGSLKVEFNRALVPKCMSGQLLTFGRPRLYCLEKTVLKDGSYIAGKCNHGKRDPKRPNIILANIECKEGQISYLTKDTHIDLCD